MKISRSNQEYSPQQDAFIEKPRKNSRRDFLTNIIIGSATFSFGSLAAEAKNMTSDLKILLKQIREDYKSIDQQRETRETLEVAELLGLSVERGGRINAPKSDTKIHSSATELIVACEVSSKNAYIKRYRSPVWPHGKSGVTVGIGYDLGYVTPQNFNDDWRSYIDTATMDALRPSCGIRGAGAGAAAKQLQSVKIEWPAAEKQFLNELQPRYVNITETALPNTSQLSSRSLGALVSLVYNRGPSFSISSDKDPNGRYEEMREIKRLMKSKDSFHLIPAQIRSMKRIWERDPNMRGVVLRREYEARLFEIGLK